MAMGKQHPYTPVGYPAPPPATGIPVRSPATNKDRKSSTNANPNPNPNLICNVVLSSLFLFTCFIFVCLAVFVPRDSELPITPRLRLNSLSVSSFDVSSFTVSGNWTASFTVENPNNQTQISYTDLHADVFYGYQIIATATRLPPFILDANSTTNLTAEFFPTLPFLNHYLWHMIVYETRRGSVEFDVSIHANALSEARGLNVSRQRYRYDAHCENLPVEISYGSAAGEFTGGGPNTCSYDLGY